MQRIDTLVIGGGQAGLAMSRSLLDRDIDHVVIERGQVAERWRTERWDSLRLLSPNWQTRLPGFRYDGPDPDGFMSMPEVIAFFERYAASFPTPIETGTTVLSVERVGAGFRVETDRGVWLADNVVIATGHSDVPSVPPLARHLSPRIVQVVPTKYRNPDQLPGGGVLVVGASATGIQLAEEIRASGRSVTLAVGRHQRLPRRYRGRDILWWLDVMGIFDEHIDQVYNPSVAISQPSLQLVGRTSARPLHVRRLAEDGVRLLGRLVAAEHDRVFFDDDLIATTAASDLKLAELLLRIDAYIGKTGLDVPPREHFEPTWPTAVHVTDRTLDLRGEKIDTVVWATGFKRRYPWLKVPVLDERGDIRQRYGITPAAGLFVLGMRFQRRRKSAFIDGVGDDAMFLADRIVKRAAYKTLAVG